MTAPHQLRTVNAYEPGQKVSIFAWTYNLWEDLTPDRHTLTCKAIPHPTGGGTIFRISATITK